MRCETFTLHPDVAVAFTGRTEGNLAVHTVEGPSVALVLHARTRVEQRLGVKPGSLAFMSQVHSPFVAVIDSDGAWADTCQREHNVPTADALVDVSARYAPAVLTADCIPIAIAASLPAGRTATAVVHAGRTGLIDGVIQNTLKALTDQHAAELEAWIGPAICGRCYEVPQTMVTDAVAALPGAASEVIASTTSWGTPSLDLPRASRAILEEYGVLVHEADECTLENSAWYSYRGENKHERNATIIYQRNIQ
ncbi:polyphenol oxidase family protein [Arthrobacter sp. HMSC08H08]|nr:laccase domain-containing protein [Arthrobacter sp. HMSC08H08]OFT24134.1 hypothetical protein HMPREF3175_02430 [Arthrobacter sp. HMSC08H08]